MSDLTIWHNPRCSKSRQTLALIEAAGGAPVIRLYLKDPPSRDELAVVAKLLNRPVIEMVRTGEAAFKEAGLTRDAGDAALLDAMAAHPILIERPIVIAGTTALIGRPPEAVQAVL